MDLKKLKDLRRERNMSIGEVSKDSGLNRNLVASIEKGLGSPGFDSVVRYAMAIGYEMVLRREVKS